MEASFAELDTATSNRMSREAEAVSEAHQAGGGAAGRTAGGETATGMLTSPVEGDADMTGTVD